MQDNNFISCIFAVIFIKFPPHCVLSQKSHDVTLKSSKNSNSISTVNQT